MALIIVPRYSSDITVVYADFSVLGSGAGTSGDPFGWSDLPWGGPSVIVLVRGTSAPYASTWSPAPGGAGSGAGYVGCNASWVPILNPYDASIPVLNSTVAGNSIIGGQHTFMSGLRVTKTSSGDCFINTAAPFIWMACLGEGAGSNAFDPTTASATGVSLVGCVGRNCTTYGLDQAVNVYAYMCEFYGNGSYNARFSGQSTSSHCLYRDGGTHGVLVNGSSVTFVNNVSDANVGDGLRFNGDNNLAAFNLLSNNGGFGIFAQGASGANHLWLRMNGYYNNTSGENNISTPGYGIWEGSRWSAVNPAYAGIAAVPPNYAISGADYLAALASMLTNQGMHAGAWQGGVSGGGGIITHPGMGGGLRG